MWYVWYFDEVFACRYVYFPGFRGFGSSKAAQLVAAKARVISPWLSFIVLPY